MLYMGCSATGAISPSCFAIPHASAISSELHSLVPQYMAHPFCSITWLNARTVSSMGVRRSGRWAYTMSTYSRSRRFKEARRPSMMCLRDRPWLLTSTSPFAPPKIYTKSDYLSWKFRKCESRLTPVQFCADDNVIAVPAVLLDSLAHYNFGLASGIATKLSTWRSAWKQLCFTSQQCRRS
jgi:hypothetical protein